jgi:hypothetical protein
LAEEIRSYRITTSEPMPSPPTWMLKSTNCACDSLFVFCVLCSVVVLRRWHFVFQAHLSGDSFGSRLLVRDTGRLQRDASEGCLWLGGSTGAEGDMVRCSWRRGWMRKRGSPPILASRLAAIPRRGPVTYGDPVYLPGWLGSCCSEKLVLGLPTSVESAHQAIGAPNDDRLVACTSLYQSLVCTDCQILKLDRQMAILV